MISRILSNLHTIRRLVVGVVKVLWILPSAKELSAGSNHSDVSVSLLFYLKIILPQDLGKTTAVFKTFSPKTICEKFFLFQKQFNSQIVFGTIEQKHLLSLRKFCKQNDVTMESVSLVHAEIISRWNNWKCSCTTHTHTHIVTVQIEIECCLRNFGEGCLHLSLWEMWTVLHVVLGLFDNNWTPLIIYQKENPNEVIYFWKIPSMLDKFIKKLKAI